MSEIKSKQYFGHDPQRMDEGDAIINAKAKQIRNAHRMAGITDGFTTKDSGERKQFESGMVRDVTEGKVDYTLVLDGPMFERWAGLLARGAAKYDKRNWMKASGEPELARFKESAFRHFMQLLRGDTDEDHAAAVIFNVNGMEYVKEKLNAKS